MSSPLLPSFAHMTFVIKDRVVQRAAGALESPHVPYSAFCFFSRLNPSCLPSSYSIMCGCKYIITRQVCIQRNSPDQSEGVFLSTAAVMIRLLSGLPLGTSRNKAHLSELSLWGCPRTEGPEPPFPPGSDAAGTCLWRLVSVSDTDERMAAEHRV